MWLNTGINASLVCALKQTHFTGDLPAEDNETERGGRLLEKG